MEAFFAAVKKSLLILLGVTLVVLVLSLPRPANRPLIGALEEVSSFRSAFAQTSAEQSLRSQAESRGALPLSALEAAEKGKRPPKFVIDPKAVAVRPLAAVSLATLEQVEAHAQPAPVSTGVPVPEALASSILWRLARTEQSGPFTLMSVELSHAELSDADLALEREVAALREQSLNERAELEAIEHRLPTLEQRVEFQSKNRSKYLGKSIMALKEARDALAAQTATHADTQAKYDAAARRADSPKKPEVSAKVPDRALAKVVLNTPAGARTLNIPVPLTVRSVPVDALPGVSFARTHAAGLWDEVKAQDPATATETIRSHFNWHMARVPLFGFDLVGAHLLQLVPLILPVLLSLLLRNIRRARTSYNPFTTEVPEKAPRIGLSNRFLEFLVTLLLPLAAVGNAVAALYLVGQLPAIPALCLLACLMMGTTAFRELEELREQMLSIVRSHSNLPPAPSAAKL